MAVVSQGIRRERTAWGLLAPTLLILGFTGLLPFVYVLYVGFFDWNVFARVAQLTWAGVANYRQLVFDTDFLASLWRGIRFTLWAVAIEMVLGFALAHLLMKSFRGRGFFRAVHALPLTIAPIAVGATWRLMTLPGFGIVPYWLSRWGIDYNIGRDATQAFFTTVVMDVWHWTPFVTLTLLAGLNALPKEPFEQAQVDGAGPWYILRYLTLPLLRPVLLTALFLRIMDALRIVDEVWMLTGGGPGTATRYAGIHVWRVVFPKTDYGYGSAMSVLLLYFTIVLCWLLMTSITQARKEGAG
ncbi:sugar ABC transporter permease [Carboxydochorda subterranea]|uniref:Sugar ABC transporter permease n=1 Tax=Carboxydichorda subterranea TaxID=3109565 RepID=A0ABZ1BWX7_9FIRM|nr:sugar ABC transporter permease [Limnochorda sp. L945t]WRP17314.1 sugar ABC transporter permease [Limnochorda sp. L945t]